MVVAIRNSAPTIELRRILCKPELYKVVILSAFYERPMLIQPTFRNKYKALASLVDKGIIYRKGEQFFFNE
jgi:hypothetical protein